MITVPIFLEASTSLFTPLFSVSVHVPLKVMSSGDAEPRARDFQTRVVCLLYPYPPQPSYYCSANSTVQSAATTSSQFNASTDDGGEKYCKFRFGPRKSIFDILKFGWIKWIFRGVVDVVDREIKRRGHYAGVVSRDLLLFPQISASDT